MNTIKTVAIAENRFATCFLNQNGKRFYRLKRVSAVVEAQFPKRYREAYYLSQYIGPVAVIKVLQKEFPGESLSQHVSRLNAMVSREDRYMKATAFEHNYPWAIKLLEAERQERRNKMAA